MFTCQVRGLRSHSGDCANSGTQILLAHPEQPTHRLLASVCGKDSSASFSNQ